MTAVPERHPAGDPTPPGGQRRPRQPAPGSAPKSGPRQPPPVPVGRRMHHLPVVAVVVVLAAGLIAISLGHWRKGAIVVGAGPLLAAVLRLVLPEREVVLLTVRGRSFDVLLLATLGVVLVVLASVVPVYYHAT